MQFSRCYELFGEDFKKIIKGKVLILGVGGVGGFALDCLYRTGVRDIVIVDYDRFEESNQNRQIGSEELGKSKVEVLAQRYKGIKKIEAKIDNNWAEGFDFDRFDVVIDAIDDLDAKVAIAKRCYPKLISSLGSARRLDPTQITTSSIWKTYNDPFAKKFRAKLKKADFKGDFLTVFSKELPKCKGLGSFVAVTGAFGLTLCAKTIERLRDEKK
ncbi:MAG: tRNA threonylcarbamoyladenosine dehydratase [Epsilonproteobacteria bacterium]|nr:tRNA threonylcarbamoyladenosine dehydratase [Campylobacterota bacterium]